MRPLGSSGVAELREPGLPLTADTSPAASEESPAAGEEPAEAAESPGPSRRWLCGSSPCGSRAQPGECGVRTVAPVSPLGAGLALARGALRATTPCPEPRKTWELSPGEQSRSPL